MSTRANKRRINQRFYGRFHANYVWRSAEDRDWDNMTPVGREFGSPDYERLNILDMYRWGNITESTAMELLGLDRAALQDMMERDGLPVDIGKVALDNPELPLQLVRDIMVSREEVKSGQVLTVYEPGAGL